MRCFSNLQRAPVWGNTPVIWRCLQRLYPFRGTASLLHYSMLFCVFLVVYCTAVARTHTRTHARTPYAMPVIMARVDMQKHLSPFLHFPVESFLNTVCSSSWCSYSFAHKFWDILTHHEDRIEPCSVFMVVPSPAYQKAYPTAHNKIMYGGTDDKGCRPNVA